MQYDCIILGPLRNKCQERLCGQNFIMRNEYMRENWERSRKGWNWISLGIWVEGRGKVVWEQLVLQCCSRDIDHDTWESWSQGQPSECSCVLYEWAHVSIPVIFSDWLGVAPGIHGLDTNPEVEFREQQTRLMLSHASVLDVQERCFLRT